MSCKHVLKTSWRRLGRRLEDALGRHIANTSWRRLQDVLEDEKCYAEDVFKTSSRRLGKQEMFAGKKITLKMLIAFVFTCGGKNYGLVNCDS